MPVLIVFDSTHHALQAEQALQSVGLPLNTIPTPREISASCGLSLSITSEHLPIALRLMHEQGVVFRSVYDVTLREGKKHYLVREEE